MGNIEVVGLGALYIDRLYKIEHILDNGEAVVDRTELAPGGSAANTIYGLAKLGVMVGFIGIVGDDVEGRILLRDFQEVGVDTSQIRVTPKAKTGSVLCLSDKLGRRSLYVTPGANSLLNISDLNLTYINQARLLHLSSFTDDKQFKVLLELMDRLASVTKLSFTPGALYAQKGLKALSPIISQTHILFINQDEIKQLTGEDIIGGARSCLKQGCKIIAVTLGKGRELELGKRANRKKVTAVGYIRDAETEHIIESSNQNIASQADTTGAGDAFATGFLYGLLRGKGPEECGHLGNIVAQFSISQIGARQGLPSLNELARRYQKLCNKQL